MILRNKFYVKSKYIRVIYKDTRKPEFTFIGLNCRQELLAKPIKQEPTRPLYW